MAPNRYVVLFLAAMAPVMGCIGSTDSSPFSDVAVSFATQSATAPAPTPKAGGSAGVSALQLAVTKVEMVLREIELKRVDVGSCDVAPEPDGCEKFETGPVLVDLPLTPGAQQLTAIHVPPGTYSQIEFEIHKVSSDPEDLAFLQQHPDFANISIRAQGTYGGTSFLYETELDAQQGLSLMPSLIVGDAGANTNITVFVDVSQWFRDQTGAEVNPEEANKGGPYESIVNENIKQSIEAFEDADEDGGPG